MLTAAAVCPFPPLLVPEVAAGAAAELDDLRRECDAVVGALKASGADRLVVVGPGERTRRHGADSGGDLAPYGVPFPIGPQPPVLPLSLAIGRWLAEREGTVPDAYVEVASDAEPGECLALGAELAGEASAVALLVMGDGSARRPPSSPGRPDDRAPAFDEEAASALARADTDALARIDPALARELMAAGRPAWQVLAGAAGGDTVKGELLSHQAPYGVGYFVARWTPDR
ncbi:class III extradiol dioxygenase subunit B-like domain-containing protein [Nocardiopsis suaedae]|uniref:Class III extradiol dioxygenase subunit B-like domain-containing protein n=1 Tax=Nocardiopsis suaedae TaxID=3018444 RepID=A0ABT4TDW8_9ACTN|nr:class III extradiol dioxygenase subunit B-like domain-containing protein [Nocardiopsis suaedae]MDA2802903.1 class III extradiol dioxygenase subunit B-like domain-containing protein [Nocardiopsis suaedae]